MESGKPMISAEELDRLFDVGEDVLQYFDVENGRVVSPKTVSK